MYLSEVDMRLISLARGRMIDDGICSGESQQKVVTLSDGRRITLQTAGHSFNISTYNGD